MMNKTSVLKLTFALAIVGMAVSAVPSFAYTPPELVLTDGTAANTVTIDSTGVVNFAAGCACTTTAAASYSGGMLTWSGTIGTFTVMGLTAETKPLLTG